MSPSPLAERIVGALLPPEAREPVLGDLAERYRSPGQYAVDAALTIPYVAFSHARRTLDPLTVAIEFNVLCLALVISAWWLVGAYDLFTSGIVNGLIVPALGLYFAFLYRPPLHRIWALMLGLLILRSTDVPSSIVYCGGALGFLLLLIFRHLIAPGGPTRRVSG